MVFSAKCVCTKHCTWHHGDVSAENLRVANPEELRFCSYDASRSKNRKRKICLPCRGRIAVENPAIPGIVQWSFTADFSQSTLGGRCGSNACTFIALYFGYLYLIDNLPPPLGDALSVEWKCALYKAMKKGNEIHDELFEGEAVDVSVEDAVSMAGTECFVDSIGESLDAFGQDCRDQLAAVFEMLCSTQLSRCSAFVSMRRTMLFVVNQDSSCMIIDSHKHGNNGALIAFCPSKSSKMLVEWLQGMLQETWQSDLRVCSVIPISYVTH